MQNYLSKEDKKMIRLAIKLTKSEFGKFSLEFEDRYKGNIEFFPFYEMKSNQFSKSIKSSAGCFEYFWEKNKNETAELMPLDIYLTELVICVHGLIYELLFSYFLPGSIKKAPSKVSKSAKSSFLSLTLSYSNIISSLVESRRNYFEGKSIIGNVLFRHFSEMMESNILALVDVEYFELIKQVPENKKEEFERWKRIKPSEIRKRLKTYFNKYIEDEEFNNIFKDVSSALYEYNSKSAHGDFHVQFHSNFKGGKSGDDKEFNPWGNDHEELKNYFTNFMVYNYNIIIVLFTAFINFHNLPMKYFGRVGKEIGFVFKVYERLMKKHLSSQIN